MIAHRRGPIAVRSPTTQLTAHARRRDGGAHPRRVRPDDVRRPGRAPDEGHDIGVPAGFTAIVVGAGISGLAAAVALNRGGDPVRGARGNADRSAASGTRTAIPAPVSTRRATLLVLVRPHDWTQYFALRDEIHDYLEQVADDFGCASIRSTPRSLGATWRRDRAGVGASTSTPARRSCRTPTCSSPRSASSTRRSIPTSRPRHLSRARSCTPRGGRTTSSSPARVAVIGNGAQRDADRPRGRRQPWRRPSSSAPPTGSCRSRSSTRSSRRRALAVPRRAATTGLVPAPARLDVQRQGPPVAPEGPGLAAPGALGQQASTTATASSSPATSRSSSATAPTCSRRCSPTTRRSASGSCSTTDGSRRSRATTSTWSPTRSPRRPRAVGHAARRSPRADVLVLRDGLRRRALPGADGDPRPRRRRRCASVWDDDDARAYLGTAVPGFPNLFMVYGPNTQPGHGGSLIGQRSRRRSHYIVDLLERMLAAGVGAIEVAPGGLRRLQRGGRRRARAAWSGRTRRWRRTTATPAGGWS